MHAFGRDYARLDGWVVPDYVETQPGGLTGDRCTHSAKAEHGEHSAGEAMQRLDRG
ncbi:MAG: hypothetical protein JWM50_663 [Microbacteriaceae bacterium]|nr:hypothetical protein [Microbacteriaceae bacterium]